IIEWGNSIWRGAALADVARAHSQAVSASEGGLNDWTTKGSLRSEVIDEALFGLPVGRLSRIIEDEEGLHIIRVVEREDQQVTPFGEVQAEIKKKLQDGDLNQHMNAYIAKLRERMPVEKTFEDHSELAARATEAAR